MLIDVHTHNMMTSSDALSVVSYYEHFERVTNGHMCSLGIHPCYIDEYEQKFALLEKLAVLPNVLAVGECGLDNMCNEDITLQNELLRRQLALAKQVDKPVVIHCVRAFDELLKTIKDVQPGVPLVAHGYNKKPEVANRLLGAGMYLSFGSAILNESWPAAGVLKNIPADRFFLETDDAAVPIQDIYEQAARIRKTEPEALILQLQQNFKDVFKREL